MSEPAALPQYATARNPANRTLGRQQAELAAALGTPLMPWQRHVVDVAGEIDPATGRMVHDIVVVSVPRQAGKTTLVRAVAMHAALQNGGRAWYTAQTRQDARDAWVDAVEAVARSPFADLCEVRRTNGSEALKVPFTGGTFRVFAPTPEGLHGRQGDRIFIDEIWSVDSLQRGDELMQAIVPTTSTRKAPQIWLLSTAGTDESVWMKRWVTEGRTGRKGVAYFEWSLPSGTDPSDLDAICEAHPAVGHTIDRRAIEAAHAAMQPGEFARAYGNQWTSAVERIIDSVRWVAAVARERIAPNSPVAFGADVAPDRSCASIVACGRSLAGRPVAEVVDHREGVGWIADRIAELDKRWHPIGICLDPIGPTSTVVDDLNSRDALSVPLTLTRSREVATACLRLYDVMHDGSETPELGIRPHPALDAAAAAAGTRPMGGGWAWDRAGSVPITPLMALTLAWWSWTHPAEVPAEVPAPAIY